MKKVSKIKRFLSLALIFLFSINSFATNVSDNDGSAFITKAEFDSLKNSFQSQIDKYNTGIDTKIDQAIVSYLTGIKLTTRVTGTILWNDAEKLIYCRDVDSTADVPKSCFPQIIYNLWHARYGGGTSGHPQVGSFFGTFGNAADTRKKGIRNYIVSENVSGTDDQVVAWYGRTENYNETFTCSAISAFNTGSTTFGGSTYYWQIASCGLADGYYPDGFKRNYNFLRCVITANSAGWDGPNGAQVGMCSIDIDNNFTESATDVNYGIYKKGLITFGADDTSRDLYFSVYDSKNYSYAGGSVANAYKLVDVQKKMTKFGAAFKYSSSYGGESNGGVGICTGTGIPMLANNYLPQMGFTQKAKQYKYMKSSVLSNLTYNGKTYNDVMLYYGLPLASVDADGEFKYTLAFTNEEHPSEDPVFHTITPDAVNTYRVWFSNEPFSTDKIPGSKDKLLKIWDGTAYTKDYIDVKGETTVNVKTTDSGFIWLKWSINSGTTASPRYTGGGNLIVDSKHRSYEYIYK